MEDETEREIKDGPAHDGNGVVAVPADRDRWRTGVGAVFERDAIIAGPDEKEGEQHERTEIAVRNEMRDGPGLHANQHRMLERAPDIAAAIGRDHENARRPHQQLREVVGPCGRGPHVDPPGRAILAEAVANENEPGKRDQRHQPLIGPLAEALDHGGTRSTQRDEDMRPEEDDKSEHENRQPHGPSLARNPCRRLRGCPAGAVEAMAGREARSSASRRTLTPPRRWAPLNSALAMSAAQVITLPPARDRLRIMSTKESERIQ